MFTRPFGFERAGRLADACELLRAHGEGAKVIAGGQSLLPLVNLGLAQPDVVIDISRADAGRDVSAADGYLTIGALITHARLAGGSRCWARPPGRSGTPGSGTAAPSAGRWRTAIRRPSCRW